MNTENTTVDTSQQPNPGGDTGAAVTTEAANPSGQPAIAPDAPGGQGNGGNSTGSNADADKPEGEGENGPKGDGSDDKPALTGAPEAYEDFTLPEGFVLEGERKDAALSLFRDLGVSQAGAQRAIDHFIKTVGEDAAVQQQAMEAAVAKQRDEWNIAAKAELGDKYDATVALARTAVTALQNPKLVEAFNEQGWGNHPEMVKVFATLGEMMRDSGVDGIGSSGAAPRKLSMEERMYPPKP